MAAPMLVRSQLALFLRSIARADSLALANTIAESVPGMFDGEPIMLPVADDVPQEVPRVIMRSRNGPWSCQAARARIDVVYEVPPRPSGDVGDEAVLTELCTTGQAVWSRLQQSHGAIGDRIGLVVLFVQWMEDPVGYVSKRYLAVADTPAVELQLHSLHHVQLELGEVNRWARCVAGEIVTDDGRRRALRLEVDVNTPPERNYELTNGTIAAFCEQAVGLAVQTQNSVFAIRGSCEKVF